jgi:6,7-dimethyl-8-ribityllumazine synthase
MATKLKTLSDFSQTEIPSAKGLKIAIAVAEWNPEITEALFSGAEKTLLVQGMKPKDLFRVNVPGSFELSSGAQLLADTAKFDAIICLGCVIQGETRHFDFICDAVANGITQVSTTYGLPVIFGVLTTNDQQQARERAGGKHGNKGDEAAVTAIKMAHLAKKLKKH